MVSQPAVDPSLMSALPHGLWHQQVSSPVAASGHSPSVVMESLTLHRLLKILDYSLQDGFQLLLASC